MLNFYNGVIYKTFCGLLMAAVELPKTPKDAMTFIPVGMVYDHEDRQWYVLREKQQLLRIPGIDGDVELAKVRFEDIKQLYMNFVKPRINEVIHNKRLREQHVSFVYQRAKCTENDLAWIKTRRAYPPLVIGLLNKIYANKMKGRLFRVDKMDLDPNSETDLSYDVKYGDAIALLDRMGD